MAKSVFVLYQYQGSPSEKLQECLKKNYFHREIITEDNFSFSISKLFSCSKRIRKAADTILVDLKGILNYPKKIYFLILFVLSGFPQVVVFQKEDNAFKADFVNLLINSALLPLFLLLSMAVFLLGGVYGLLSAILLKILSTGKFKAKQNTDEEQQKKLFFLAPSLHLLDTFRGSTSHVRGTLSGFKNCGWQAFILSPGMLEGVTAEYCIIPPLLQNFLTGGAVDILYDFVFFIGALNTVKINKPAFFYQRHGRFCLSGVLLSHITAIPLVLEVNAYISWESRRWGRIGGGLHKLMTLYENLSLKYAYRISAISTRLIDDLSSKVKIDRNKMFVNPNGADTDSFKPGCGGDTIRKKYGIEDKQVLGFAGSFYPWHGIDFLGEVIERTLKRFPMTVFLLIGEGPEKPALQNRIQNCLKENRENSNSKDDDCSGKVVFTGRIPPEQVPEYLDACDILLSPIGKGKEYSSPIKIFEYMASAKAILCFEGGQMSEILEQGKEAYMTPPDDIEKFMTALEELIENRELRESLGEAARRRVKAQYTWKANAERILDSLGDIYSK